MPKNKLNVPELLGFFFLNFFEDRSSKIQEAECEAKMFAVSPTFSATHSSLLALEQLQINLLVHHILICLFIPDSNTPPRDDLTNIRGTTVKSVWL